MDGRWHVHGSYGECARRCVGRASRSHGCKSVVVAKGWWRWWWQVWQEGVAVSVAFAEVSVDGSVGGGSSVRGIDGGEVDSCHVCVMVVSVVLLTCPGGD